ncbi:hypothetical protein PF010_g14622 [Phytophthora fragariae]|uniref:HTH psq-type domain-containing protein n=1 Tax=Phytophthora fragariae TaxID=53985 RepID=A0A6G0KWX6_9STRA|nr:hypothetical protein PF003_g40780 [Phytophthora fragariae]KAE9100937.1 hypothetical protein PF010_g14622 [Phytophthora fragariae]KAE9217648.1 hypothetical protein PF004_g14088 [Phytophthora fragariae]
MVIRRSCYNKEDLEEAVDRSYEGETFAAVARSSSAPLCTLFKKSDELQTAGEITEFVEGQSRPFLLSRRQMWWRGLPVCSALASLWAHLG